ncbi:4'-phosphopantetheinyl transferase family protein [Streptomyces sp. NPDC053560]|uniref:4'-phosphopantetheinyl transferase family protein n=1 Tax=Streptomyces sp. NPDC053560 TaxID=3365711 RepID=UPI0037D7718B
MEVRAPIAVSGRTQGWEQARTDFAECGTVLLHTELAPWLPTEPENASLRELLGRDWTRYLGIAHPDIRARYAASRAFLKHAAAAVRDCAAEELELAYGPTGRPYLRGCEQIDISLGHTEDLLVVGATARGLIGVDAERTDRPLYDRGMARSVCTPYELVTISGLAEPDRNPALVRLRTLKDAYTKAIGQGLNLRATEFGFGPDGEPVRIVRPDGMPGTGDQWVFHTSVLPSGHCVSAAVYDTGPSPASATRCHADPRGR